MRNNTLISTKWDKGRLVIIWWSPWTAFTIHNSVGAARRSGCWLVVACVQKELSSVIDGRFKVSSFQNYSSIPANTEIFSLCNKSNAVCFWMWIEEDSGTISKIVQTLLSRVEIPLVLDADGVKSSFDNPDCLSSRKESKRETVLTMNPQETEFVFWSHFPNEKKISQISKEFGLHIVLKGLECKIFLPNGSITRINTNDCPEMANAWCGDVLTGLIWWLIAQGTPAEHSIIQAIRIRQEAAKFYLRTYNDITVQPEDIVENIRNVIGGIRSKTPSKG